MRWTLLVLVLAFPLLAFAQARQLGPPCPEQKLQPQVGPDIERDRECSDREAPRRCVRRGSRPPPRQAS